MDDGKLMIGEKYVLVENRKKMDENRNRLKYMQNAGQLISATFGKMSADLGKYVQEETFIRILSSSRFAALPQSTSQCKW